MAYDILEAAAQNALNTLGINAGGSNRSAVSLDDINVGSDASGKAHKAYAQKLIDDQKSKQYLADLATQTAAYKAQTAALAQPVVAPVAAAVQAAIPAATRYLTADDVKKLDYSSLARGFQEVAGNYSRNVRDPNLSKQYNDQMSIVGGLMAAKTRAGLNKFEDNTMEYSRFAPYLSKYAADAQKAPAFSYSLSSKQIDPQGRMNDNYWMSGAKQRVQGNMGPPKPSAPWQAAQAYWKALANSKR